MKDKNKSFKIENLDPNYFVTELTTQEQEKISGGSSNSATTYLTIETKPPEPQYFFVRIPHHSKKNY